MQPVDVPKFKTFDGTPTRDNCDRQNPSQAYLWGLLELPYKMFPLGYWILLSERLFDLFGPPNPDWVPQEPQKLGPRKPLAQFPTREACDPTDPRQAYLWGFVGLPFMRGAPLLFGIEDLELWSVKIWDLFGPPNPDWVPRLKYRIPLPTDADALTSAGQWTEVDG